MKSIAGLVLSGGQATRLGGVQKSLLKLDDQSLLELVLARLAPQVDAVAISANAAQDEYSAFGYPVLGDQLAGYLGPLAGVHAGMVWARDRGFSHVLSVAGDTPFFPLDLAERMNSAVSATQPIAMAALRSGEGKAPLQPTFGLWPVDLADDLRLALLAGTRKIVAWAQPHGLVAVAFGDDDDGDNPFFNINTPEDLVMARRMVQGART